jgi:Uma2 family endonuclease
LRPQYLALASSAEPSVSSAMTKKSLARGPLSLEEFLAFENGAPERHEFVRGRVFAMSGTTVRHNRVATNIYKKLDAAARGGPCQVYVIDLKVQASSDRVYYPDAVVVCAPHDDATLMFDAPCLVVEVTSRSTRRVDRGEKLDAYLAMPSLRGYLIAEHDRRHVTLYTREPGGEWMREEVVGSGEATVPCPHVSLSLDDIYDGVEPVPLHVREDAEDATEDYEWIDVTYELT